MTIKYPVNVSQHSPFPLENIPFGVFHTVNEPTPRIGSIIGDWVLDLKFLALKDVFSGEECNKVSCLTTKSVLSAPNLNKLASQSRDFCSSIRNRIINYLSDANSILFTDDDINLQSFVFAKDAIMHLPMHIGGFTDFLCSETHATNCARLAGQSLHPTFHIFPTAYNGRASSVVVSGTPFQRPHGMVRTKTSSQSSTLTYAFKPTAQLDFELEIGVFISNSIPFNTTLATADEAAAHIFGYVLLNDLSARDVQFAEMIPLGPFNGKASMTTISPWVVMPDALSFAQCGPSNTKTCENAHLLPAHLRHSSLEKSTFDVELTVSLIRTSQAKPSSPDVICVSNLRHLSWSPAQMLSHHASSGCGLNAGDLLGTGTISGPGHVETTPTLGCLFELTEAGRKPVALDSGRDTRWLEDGDEVVFRGFAGRRDGKDGQKGGKAKGRIGFGECRVVIMPARRLENATV